MNTPTPYADMTLDALRPLLAEAMLPHVPFDGWSDSSVDRAAADLGINPAAARLAFDGKAARMIEAMIDAADSRMILSLDTPEFHSLKIRDKITTAIWTRLNQALPHREALRRATVILALPSNLALAARLGWQTAGRIWVAAGVHSTDFSWYSRRATVASVYSATLLYWLNDDSDGQADTKAFLDRRIANVMQFETAKAKLKARTGGERLSVARFLGRLRYPVEG